MKRSDRDEEVSPVIKEPRLESQELRTSSSSATEQLRECDKDQSSSVSLATKLRIKAATERTSGGSRRTFIEENWRRRMNERLRGWSKVLSAAGYFCEVRYLMKELSKSLVEQQKLCRYGQSC